MTEKRAESSAVDVRKTAQSAPQIRKAGRLGNDRPSLGARLGVGLSKPWGVWEGGFDERLGRPPAGYLRNQIDENRLPDLAVQFFQRTSLSWTGTSLIHFTLTNGSGLRHLQYCISDSGSILDLLEIAAHSFREIGKKQHAGKRKILGLEELLLFIYR